MELSPSWEALVVQSLQNLLKFCGTRRFITVFTRAHCWSISWAKSILSIPSHPIFLIRSILILSSPISGASYWSLSYFQPKSYMHCSSPPSVPDALPISSCSVDHSNFIWWRVQVIKLLITYFLQLPVTWSLRSKYSPPHPVLSHPQSYVLPLRSETKLSNIFVATPGGFILIAFRNYSHILLLIFSVLSHSWFTTSLAKLHLPQILFSFPRS
jgi:hypothetical protein